MSNQNLMKSIRGNPIKFYAESRETFFNFGADHYGLYAYYRYRKIRCTCRFQVAA